MFALLTGCTPGGVILLDDDDDTTGDDDDVTAIPDIEIGDWESCALIPGEGSSGAECAEAWMPMDYGDPDGEQLPVLVKRLRGSDDPSGQLWLLHGGPGASALDDMAYMAHGVPDARPDLTVYAVDHRGIGGSGRLGCPDQEDPDSDWGESISDAEWADCIYAITEQWGDGLDQITTSNSARDLGTLIHHLDGGDDEIFVYGGSYGTYLAQRYLQIFPDQPDGVVIDGISPPGQGFMEYDLGMEITGENMMDACAADPSCAAHFEGDPWTTAQDVVASLDHGHCAALGADSGTLRYLFGALLMYDKVRDLVPAVVHRLERCDDADIEAIVNLWYTYFGVLGETAATRRLLPRRPEPRFIGQAGNDGNGYSHPLFFHIATSDMWDPETGPSYEEAVAAWETYTMATGLTGWVAEMVPRWPSFPHDEYVGGFSDYTGPLLMLQGGLDPATPVEFADVVGEHYTADAQTWALFPQGAHGLITGSLLPSGDNCGELLYMAFLDDPAAELDTSCIGQTLGVQFDGYPEYTHYFLGTPDAWGD